MRGLVDPHGEVFAYLRGQIVYTLDDEPTGRIEGDHVVDLAGRPVWRLVGDALYSLTTMEPIGYIGEEMPAAYEL